MEFSYHEWYIEIAVVEQTRLGENRCRFMFDRSPVLQDVEKPQE